MARGPASWAAPVAVTASAPISWLRDLAALSWSLVTTTAAVGLGVLVVGGVRVGQLGPLAVALAAVTVLDTLVQPLLRPLAAFGSVVLALVLGFGFQVALVLAALRFTPGVSSSGWRDTAAVLLIAAGILAATRWVLGSSDTSYVVGHALRRGGARGVRHRRRTGLSEAAPRRGLLVVQLDGVSPAVLRTSLDAGLAPNLARWLDEGTHRMATWWVPVPCTTPAAMAALMHGDRDQIAAFRWWDRDLGRLLVTNRPADAAVVERRLRRGDGLLREGGVAVSTMFSGEADTTLLVMSRAAGARGLGSGSAFIPFFASLSLVPASVLLSLGEVVKELHQARRQRVRGVAPRVRRRATFVIARGISNVLLRRLNLTLVVEQMTRGAPAIYVDMVDYDEIAHHAGPLRPEALRALEGLDAVLGRLQQVARMVDVAYELVVLSDHGQSLGSPFEQVSGRTLTEVVRRLMREDAVEVVRAEAGEEWGPLNTLIASVLGGVARQDRVLLGPDRGPRRPVHPAGTPDLAVIGSGNLGMVWFPQAGDRQNLDEIESRWPGLIPGLLLTPGIGVVMARTPSGGCIVLGQAGAHHLGTGIVEGVDPLAPYPVRAAADLRRLGGLATCGDLVLISSVHPDGQVHAFESMVGSHGGLGGEQNRAVLLHPGQWRIEESLLEPVGDERMIVGGWNVHEQLLRWRSSLTEPASGEQS
jgi:hypothetical protein